MARYNPMQSVRALSGLQLSGQGEAWEGKQRGLGRQAIQEYLDKQASDATRARQRMSLLNLFAKGAGLYTMAQTGSVEAAGTVSGGISALGGHLATRGLRKEKAPDVLYGLPEAEKAESYAHQSIDTLMGSVLPQALTTAITTPLEYMSLQNTFNPTTAGEVAMGKASGMEASPYAIGKSGYGQGGFQDLLSLVSESEDIPFDTNLSNYYNNPYTNFG